MESSSQNNKGLKWIKRIAIILILAGVIYALYPKIEGIINSAKKIADIANARNIYNTMSETLILDELETPKENIYIDLSDNPINEEDENKIDIKYIYKVKNILKESLNYYSKYTKLNKNKSFVIYITTDGDLTIYVSPVDSNEIEEIYPKGEGVYR
ncbi:MAG: hypothetical protein KH333_07320 [Clostridium sp.]|mgnify:FL=1|nr:hypothetical protein [Clostridium sp.]